jgi:indole-3-glycerol phosphate synthase
MTNILKKIKSYKIEEIKASKRTSPTSSLEQQAKQQPSPLGFESALRAKQKISYGIIAEIKKASPSKGIIRHDFNVGKIANSYELGGAACLSVLTDFNSFQGKKSYIAEAKASSSIPILRKDFLYDPYQVLETRAIGADCILVIMATVSDQQAKELEDCANFWGMDVLIEVHDESELERALQLNSKFIGINNRNLKTFNIRLETTEELVLKIPKDYLIVSESGLTNKNDLIRMVQANVRSFLIGESLMRQNDIKSAIEGLLD